MATIGILTTGGTVASERADDAYVARRPGPGLIDGLAATPHRLVTHELARRGSYQMQVADLGTLVDAIRRLARAPEIAGIVVTHGTDTLEESAFAVDLCHQASTPVVFTGAQRPADAPDADGPGNLHTAIRLAGTPEARDRGVLVSFAGLVWPACGVTKSDTYAFSAFSNRISGPAARATPGGFAFESVPPRSVPYPGLEQFDNRVELLHMGLGMSGLLIDAAVDSGTAAIVVEAFGTGNVPPPVADAVARATAAGVTVVVATRASCGAASPVYGGAGGAVRLRELGAYFAGDLSGAQARIFLMAGLTRSGDPGAELETFVAARRRSTAVTGHPQPR